VGLSRATIYRKIDSGEFPKPVHLSSMRRAWMTRDVMAWLQSVEEARFA
jgi:predicted DNA-binding transcriptional regulator AlpA